MKQVTKVLSIYSPSDKYIQQEQKRKAKQLKRKHKWDQFILERLGL